MLADGVRLTVKIPMSSERAYKGPIYAKLVRELAPDPGFAGFSFEGKFLRPGRTIEESELWPPGYPDRPLVLECAGITGMTASGRKARGPGDRNRSEVLYILWQYDVDCHQWGELGRAVSDSSAWALDLIAIAKRVLAPPMPQSAPDLAVVSNRISELLDRELNGLTDLQRAAVIGVVHDQFAFRLAKCA